MRGNTALVLKCIWGLFVVPHIMWRDDRWAGGGRWAYLHILPLQRTFRYAVQIPSFLLIFERLWHCNRCCRTVLLIICDGHGRYSFPNFTRVQFKLC